MPPPRRQEPPQDWDHYQIYERVRRALYALSGSFKTETVISGIRATDIFTLGDPLGATVEEQVVKTLNEMRLLWDPTGEYKLYSFERQAQVFPDVRLQARHDGEEIVMGIELKGWYLLAKEAMPNFRFTVTEAACNPQDLLVVVPWALTNVLSGSPVVFAPYVESAKYAAAHRNYYWQEMRETKSTRKSSRKIAIPAGVKPYPKKADRIADEPADDTGGNFGRIARTGLMDEYIERTLRLSLCGIEAKEWIGFFKKFAQ